jgi:hypothetical protein
MGSVVNGEGESVWCDVGGDDRISVLMEWTAVLDTYVLKTYI